MYSISHPDKYGVPHFDLSADEEARIFSVSEHLFSFNQLCIERVITKLFSHYKCDVVITDRLRSLFTSKLTRMGKAIQGQGGPGRQKLLNKWKDSKWILELDQQEIVPTIRKRKPNGFVVQSCKKKCVELEEKIQSIDNKLKNVTNKLNMVKKSNKKLSKALISKTSVQPSATVTKQKRNSKSWSEYSVQYKNIKKRQFANDVATALTFVEDTCFKPMEIEFVNKVTGERLCVESNGKSKECKDRQQTDNDTVEKTMYVKDRYKISNKAYHELSMVNSKLPRSGMLIKKAKKLDMKSCIYATPGKATGVQQSILERLQKAAEWLVTADSSLSEHRNIKVKITGDGTSISRSTHCVVIAFTIINEVALPNSPRGNHTVAIINAMEDYDTLSESLADISNEIKEIHSIQINEVEYTIEWFFTADLKFLALCSGIEAANSRFACVWCKCPSESRYDTSKKWSMTNTEEGARTIKEIQELAQLHKKKRK